MVTILFYNGWLFLLILTIIYDSYKCSHLLSTHYVLGTGWSTTLLKAHYSMLTQSLVTGTLWMRHQHQSENKWLDPNYTHLCSKFLPFLNHSNVINNINLKIWATNVKAFLKHLFICVCCPKSLGTGEIIKICFVILSAGLRYSFWGKKKINLYTTLFNHIKT